MKNHRILHLRAKLLRHIVYLNPRGYQIKEGIAAASKLEKTFNGAREILMPGTRIVDPLIQKLKDRPQLNHNYFE
jgi:hypothetical protein